MDRGVVRFTIVLFLRVKVILMDRRIDEIQGI